MINSLENKAVIFAGGCFWCVEHDLRKISGVVDVFSGYANNLTEQSKDSFVPTYENHAGYREAVQVIYNPLQTSFKKLTQFFLDHIDPTDSGGQFHDRGESYKTAIYFGDEQEEITARELLEELDHSGIYTDPVVVDVLPKGGFYTAEEYHQNYGEKNPVQYMMYRVGSGRENFVNNVCQIRDQKKILWKE